MFVLRGQSKRIIAELEQLYINKLLGNLNIVSAAYFKAVSLFAKTAQIHQQ